MKYHNYKYWLWGLLAVTFVLNFIQAFSTGIISDEAYYKLFGANLSWGYFDHPPAVALLIRISSLLFSGSLGIRFMSTVMHVFTLYITWKAIDDKTPDTSKVLLFFLVASSFVMLTVYGFVTTPDVPLLFFTALFLYAYKRFLNDANMKIVFILGIAMAGLVYSKYHAALVIGFVVFSNLRLLKNGRFWISAILALMLLSPHFYWQYSHGFPTFKYHLIDRATEFEWQYILEYIPNTLVVFNPFAFIAIVYILIKYKPADMFERALYFLIIGFIMFFWISGFRGHVQPQWTVAATIPMIIILYNRIQENKKLKNYALKTFIPILFALMIMRVLIAENKFVASVGCFEKERPRTQFISKVAGNLPVVFLQSFQEPSKYYYFASKKAFTLSSVTGRSTQFDIWQYEKQYHNKPAFICDSIYGRSKKFSEGELTISGFFTDSLQTVNRMVVDFKNPVQVRQGDSLTIPISVDNPYPFSINFHHAQFPVSVSAFFIHKDNCVFQAVRLNTPINIIESGNTVKREIRFKIPKLKPGKYKFGVCLSTCLSNSQNSKLVTIAVE